MRHPLQHDQRESDRGRAGPQECLRAALNDLPDAESGAAQPDEKECRGDEPRASACAGTASKRCGSCVGDLLAQLFELGGLVFGLEASRQALLLEGRASVEFESHLAGRFARLGENPDGLVETNGVAFGGVILVPAVPRGHEIDEPERDGDQKDHSTAQYLPAHADHGMRARSEQRDVPGVSRRSGPTVQNSVGQESDAAAFRSASGMFAASRGVWPLTQRSSTP